MSGSKKSRRASGLACRKIVIGWSKQQRVTDVTPGTVYRNGKPHTFVIERTRRRLKTPSLVPA